MRSEKIREVAVLKSENDQTQQQIAALKELQETKAYSNSAEVMKEEYKRKRDSAYQLELAEKADKLERENADKQFKHDTSMNEGEYQKVYVEQQNQAKN